MNHYSKAIDSLKRITQDKAMDIIYEIAKSNPAVLNSAFSEAIRTNNGGPVGNEAIEAIGDLISACTGGWKIHAIKYVRFLAGVSLKEAKGIVDSNWERQIL